MRRSGEWTHFGNGRFLRRSNNLVPGAMSWLDPSDHDDGDDGDDASANREDGNHGASEDGYTAEDRQIGDFDTCLAAGAPFGGPIAVLDTYHRSSPSSASSNATPLKIFTAHGTFLHYAAAPDGVSWSTLGKIATLGWNQDENLVVATQKGTVLVYNRGTRKPPLVLRFTKGTSDDGSEAAPPAASGAAPHYIGAASRCTEIRSVAVVAVQGCRLDLITFPDRLSELPKLAQPINLTAEEHGGLDGVTCIEVRPKVSELDEHVALVAGTGLRPINGGVVAAKQPGKGGGRQPALRTKFASRVVLVVVSLVSFEAMDVHIELPTCTPVTRIAVSPFREQLALWLASGVVLVVQSDLSAVNHSIDFGTGITPTHFSFCGPTFLHALFSTTRTSAAQNRNDDEFNDDGEDDDDAEGGAGGDGPLESSPVYFSLFFGATKMDLSLRHTLQWSMDEGLERVVPVVECDGVRFIAHSRSIFVEEVCLQLCNIFKLKSNAKAARLCQACIDCYDHADVRAVAKLRALLRSAAVDSVSSDAASVAPSNAEPMGTGAEELLDDILEAAVNEHEPAGQERLLRIVALCKTSVAKFDNDAYVDAIKRLRLLNHLRATRGGQLPITLRQYRVLGGSDARELIASEAQVLLDRLTHVGRYHTAIELAEYLRLDPDNVLMEWSVGRVLAASVAIKQQIGGHQREASGVIEAADASVFNEIHNRLATRPTVSYVEAALAAYSSSRPGLAVRLLNAEPRPQTQVLLLLQMKQFNLALEKAASLCDDADLLLLVVLRAHEALPWNTLVSALNTHPDAFRMFHYAAGCLPSLEGDLEQMLTESNAHLVVAMEQLDAKLKTMPIANPQFREGDLGDFVVLRDDRCSYTDLRSTDVVDEPVIAALLASLSHGMPTGGTGAAGPGGGAAAAAPLANGSVDPAIPRFLKMQAELLTEQRQLVAQLGADIVNETAAGTIRRCIAHGLPDKQIEGLRHKYHIPDKKFWFLKLQALCEAKNWDAVDKMGGAGAHSSGGLFSTLSASPIGYLPFVETLAAHGRADQAAAYVAKLTDVAERVEWYIQLDHFQRAIDDAADEGQPELLHQIRRRAQNPQVVAYIDKRLAALGA